MKKFTHKLAALGLSLVLSAGLLSGCGESYDPIQEEIGRASCRERVSA